jgi:hypothetical protein
MAPRMQHGHRQRRQLVPGGANLFALRTGSGSRQTDYFIVQGIYRGWALFALVIIPALLVNLLLAYLLRAQRRPALLVLCAAFCLGLMLLIFFIWTQPANVATASWTRMSASWQSLRMH